MIRISALLIVVMFIMLAATACARQAETEPDVETIPEFTPTVAEMELPLPIDVCEPLDIPGAAFPRQAYVEGPRAMMEAELIGVLELVDGILMVDSLYGDGRIIPVWPAEFTLAYEDHGLTIYNGDGTALVRTGEEVYMGGGEGSDSGMLDCVRQLIPESYSGKFWYVGDGVRPNLPHDSELVQFDLVPGAERTAILIRKQPVLDEWIEEPGVISGILRLYSPQRCPRVQS